MPPLRGSARSQHAASETVGTILLLAIAVALAGVFALTIFTLPPPQPSSHATLQAFTPPATDQLVIEHRGGPPIPLSALTATVTVNGTATQFNVASGVTAGSWSVVSASGASKTAADSFVAGDQAIYTAPALWGAATSVTVVNGATTGVAGAALALEPTTVQAADSTPPTFLSARTTSTTTIQVNFTEPVRNMTDPTTPDSLSPVDFTVQVLGTSYSVSGIHLLSNGSAAEIAVSPAMPTDALPWINSTATPRYASDLAGNAFAASASTRATDGVAPGITGVLASGVSTAGATIAWTTDEAATTNLVYAGPTQSLGFTAVAATGTGTSHTATLTGLSDNMQYFYQVVSADPSGNAATSAQFQFTTTQIASSSSGPSINHLSLPSGASLTSGVVSPAFTLTLKDVNGTAVNASSPLVVSLATNSSSGSFFLDAAGATPTTTVTIPASQSSTTFYYLDYRDYGNSVITANAEGVVSVATVVQVDQTSGHTFPYHLAFTATPAMPMSNGVDVSGFTVTLKDSFERDVIPPWPLTVNLATNSTVGYFVSPSSSSTITSLTLNGAASASFKYHDARGGDSLVLAYANATQPASAAVTIAGSSSVFAMLSQAQTWTAAQTFGAGLLNATNLATPSGTLALPTGNDTLLGRASVDAITGAKTFSTGTLKAADVSDANGNKALILAATASAVNQVTVTDAAAGNAPSLSASGADAAINLNLAPKGSGSVQINGQPISLAAGLTTTGSAITFANGATATYTLPGQTDTLAALGKAQTWTAQQTYGAGLLKVSDLTVGAATLSLPSSTDTLLGRASTDTISGAKTFNTGTLKASDVSDASGNKAIILSAVGSANQITVSDAAAAGTPKIQASGSDLNVGLNLASKGSGSVQINGQALSLAGPLTTSGANALTFTTTGSTSVTLPTSGTLLSTASAVTVPQGGTGAATFTTHGVLVGEGTGAIAATGTGSSGQALLSTGSSSDPAYGALNLAGGSGVVTGTLPAGNLPTAAAATAGIVPSTGLTNAMVASGAAIAYSKLNLASSVTSSDIVDATITASDLASSSVTSAKISSFAGHVAKVVDPPSVTCNASADTVIDTYTVTDGQFIPYKIIEPARVATSRYVRMHFVYEDGSSTDIDNSGTSTVTTINDALMTQFADGHHIVTIQVMCHNTSTSNTANFAAYTLEAWVTPAGSGAAP